MYNYARTTTRIRKDADKEHGERDPDVRRHMNLRMLMYCFAFYPCLRMCLCLSVLVSVKRMNAWVTDPHAQLPLGNDAIFS